MGRKVLDPEPRTLVIDTPQVQIEEKGRSKNPIRM